MDDAIIISASHPDRERSKRCNTKQNNMSTFNDIDERTKKGNTETCLHNVKEVAAFATQFKPGHWRFLGPTSENTWCKRNYNEPQGHFDNVAKQMVDIFKCNISHPIFPATEPLSLGQLRKGGSVKRIISVIELASGMRLQMLYFHTV